MPSIREVFLEAQKAGGTAVESMAIRLLLRHLEHFATMSDLIVHMDQPITALEEFRVLFARLLAGEPVQYVIHEADFYGLRLYVDPRVLIPRPETEELVALVIKDIKAGKFSGQTTVVDIATGSGCIALALKKQNPAWDVIGTDLSFDALDVAKRNAEDTGLSVRWLQGDMALPLLAHGIRATIVVSNPPYIPDGAPVDTQVLAYEPHEALFAGDGLRYFEKILKIVPLFVIPEGRLYFEMHFDQKEALTTLIHQWLPHALIDFTKDLQGKDRFVTIIYQI